MKKRIFFILYSMSVGGVEKSFLGFLSTLDRNEYEVHVGLLRNEGGFMQILPSEVIVHHCFQGLWRIVNRPPMETIKDLIKEGHLIEASVHVFLYLVYKITSDRTLFYQYVLRKEPLIEGVFDVAHAYAGPVSMLDYYICEKIKAKKKYGWIHFDITKFGIDKRMTRRLYKNYEKIFVVSETAKEKFDGMFPEFAYKTEVRYNVVPREQILLQAELADTFVDDFDGKRILTVGRLSKEKGQDVTIEVLKSLVDKGYDVKWYYVGEGKLRSECEQKAKDLGVSERAMFLGLQTNPYGYMRDCDVYVQPSRHEGYCITLAEARCFTAPIVSTNFTGAEEQLKSYPRSVVTGMNAEDIANGIIQFL